MAFTINAFNHREWARYGLADYGDFADMVTECNQGEDAFAASASGSTSRTIRSRTTTG